MKERSLPVCFSYEECDIPEGLTIAQWRTMRAGTPSRRRRWRRLVPDRGGRRELSSESWVYDYAVLARANMVGADLNSRDVQQELPHGEVLTAISDGLVALLKEFYGRGPNRAKSYYEDDLVVCVLRGGFSRVEQTLLEGGRGTAVIQQRMEFQELMRERFEEVIEDATGRRVIGFMSGNQQDPDMMCEVFVLAPSDLVDDHEIPDRGRPRPSD
jgi:uncharacterized protein YbcI